MKNFKKLSIILVTLLSIFLVGCNGSYNNSSYSDTIETIREAESFTLVGDYSTYYYDGEVIYFETEILYHQNTGEEDVVASKTVIYYYDIGNDEFYIFDNQNWYLDDYRIMMVLDLKTLFLETPNKDFIGMKDVGGFLGFNDSNSIVVYNDDFEVDLAMNTTLFNDLYHITNLNETTIDHPDLEGALVNEVTDIRIQALYSDTTYDFYTYESVDWGNFMHLYATFSAYPEEKELDLEEINPDIDYKMEVGIQNVTVTYYGKSCEFEFFFYDPDNPIVLARYEYDSDIAFFLGYCYVSELDSCNLTYENIAFDIDSWDIIVEDSGYGYEGDYHDLTVNALIHPILKPININDMLAFFESSDLSSVSGYTPEQSYKYFLTETELYDVSNNLDYVYTNLANHESYILYSGNEEWIKIDERNPFTALEEILELAKTLEFEALVDRGETSITGDYYANLDPNEYDGIYSIHLSLIPEMNLIKVSVYGVDSQQNSMGGNYSIYFDGNTPVDSYDEPFCTDLKKPT